jgi:hypothetical protein
MLHRFLVGQLGQTVFRANLERNVAYSTALTGCAAILDFEP